MQEKKPFRILSCDGGGIRGLLTAVLLERLEQKLESKLSEHFDMFAGTSTGSIIACALSQGMSASTIKELYLKDGKTIFPEMNWEYWLDTTLEKFAQGHASLPLFKSDGLDSVLKDHFTSNNPLFGSLQKPTLVVSYDAYNRSAVVFKSWQTEFSTIDTWEVCRASSSAPVAFPGYFLTNKEYVDEQEKPTSDNNQSCIDTATNMPIKVANYNGVKGFPLIDGGVVANNPSLCALAESISLNQEYDLKNDFILASFGTGQSKHRISPEHVETWGGLAWVNFMAGIPLMDVFADGSADATDYIAIQMIKDNYHRFQPLLEEGISTFQADDKNLEKLVASAEKYLDNEGGDSYLSKLVSKVRPQSQEPK